MSSTRASSSPPSCSWCLWFGKGHTKLLWPPSFHHCVASSDLTTKETPKMSSICLGTLMFTCCSGTLGGDLYWPNAVSTLIPSSQSEVFEGHSLESGSVHLLLRPLDLRIPQWSSTLLGRSVVSVSVHSSASSLTTASRLHEFPIG